MRPRQGLLAISLRCFPSGFNVYYLVVFCSGISFGYLLGILHLGFVLWRFARPRKRFWTLESGVEPARASILIVHALGRCLGIYLVPTLAGGSIPRLSYQY